MKCPKCGHESSEGAKFCGKCGQPLRLEHTCSQCGHTNPSDNSFCEKCGHALVEKAPTTMAPPSPQPTSFAGGRYKVKKFLGEGGKKKVYLAHDTTLDRDVAFALIMTEKLDEVARRVLYARLRPWDVSATTRISLPYTIWGSMKESPTPCCRRCPAAMWKGLSRKRRSTGCPSIRS